MPGNRTPLLVHVLRSLERKMNAPLTVPTRRRVSGLFLGFLLEVFFWAMKRDLPRSLPGGRDDHHGGRSRARRGRLIAEFDPDARQRERTTAAEDQAARGPSD